MSEILETSVGRLHWPWC